HTSTQIRFGCCIVPQVLLKLQLFETRRSQAEYGDDVMPDNTPSTACKQQLLSRVEIDNALDCAPAHRTETNVVPGEHDAVDLRPVVALCLVVRALEGAYLSRVLLGGKHLRLVLLLFLEQRIHVPLWPALAPDLPASFLDCARVPFERF